MELASSAATRLRTVTGLLVTFYWRLKERPYGNTLLCDYNNDIEQKFSSIIAIATHPPMREKESVSTPNGVSVQTSLLAN